jgi:hypothetical protein
MALGLAESIGRMGEERRLYLHMLGNGRDGDRDWGLGLLLLLLEAEKVVGKRVRARGTIDHPSNRPAHADARLDLLLLLGGEALLLEDVFASLGVCSVGGSSTDHSTRPRLGHVDAYLVTRVPIRTSLACRSNGGAVQGPRGREL